MAERAAAPAAEIIQAPFATALGERYLAYALSTITSRSLPDARDGLKPVHRRLLYAMRQLRLDPSQGFKKCARVVGDVIGKYHPHGDVAVYDALVRLAQDFAVRYPLVEGQGNFGNVDGDNAAAMRYTEARLTEYALALLEGLDDNAVDFRPNYDGSEDEPVVMPGAVPNLLANGAAGIAVGMATSIPPHNLAELCQAALHLIKFPKATVGKMMEFVPGPDFPTGGVLVEPKESIADAYATGRGGFRLRARWAQEKLKHGLYQIVVSEIPYQVQKARLIEKIADLLNEKKLPLVADVHDESDAEIRIVIEPRNRSVPADAVMESLFRSTDLEVRVGLNMNVLDREGRPRIMNLREGLTEFLDHRHEVLKRRAAHRLAQIDHRLEVLAGYLIVYLNLDAVIRIIRKEDEPKPALMKRFKLTDNQAEAILNMRLRALRRLEEMEIKREHDALEAERKDLRSLMRDEKKRWARVGEEIKDIAKRFGKDTKLGKRRTEIGKPVVAEVVNIESFIEKEPVTVICSEKGWIRAAKGHNISGDELKYKEGDAERFVLKAETTDKLLVFGTNGRFYTIGVDKLPGGRGNGEAIRLMIDLGNDQDIVNLLIHKPGRKLLVAASDGRGFVVGENEVVAQTRNGKQALNLKDKTVARVCVPAEGDTVALVGENRKMLIFPIKELPVMTRGRGITLQRYKDGGLSDATVFNKADGLSWKLGENTRTETDLTTWIGKRAQAGRMAPRGFAKANKFG
jgi:topoisomerase-4 subunit A